MTYQTIVMLQGEDSQEALEAYWHGGAREVLDLLTEYDEGKALDSSEFTIAEPNDESMRIGDYNVIVNPEDRFVALELVT